MIYADKILPHLQPNTRCVAFQFLEMAGHTAEWMAKERAIRAKYLERLEMADTEAMNEKEKAQHQTKLYRARIKARNDHALVMMVNTMASYITRLEGALNEAVGYSRRCDQELYQLRLNIMALTNTVDSMNDTIQVFGDIILGDDPEIPQDEQMKIMRKNLPYWERMIPFLSANGINHL